ncbi:MAG: hypothetical protein HY290_08400, partial [Planctomycetia bacterium]|nr:hypothetical protein [Planctomycetia bacterium]
MAPIRGRGAYWALIAALACGATGLMPTVDAQTGNSAAKKATPGKSRTEDRGQWGEPADGVRLRTIAVAAETDEQKPDFHKAKLATEYPTAKDVTLLVELQNVSNKPLSLQGTRYGDAVTPPWPGKSVSDSFAPYLFECDVLGQNGKPVDHPQRVMLEVDTMMSLSSGQAETIEPGKSLVVLIRPLGWDATLARAVGPGQYTMRVRYRGPGEGVVKEMQRVWPDKPLTKVWAGNAASAPISFRIAESKLKARELVWGEVTDGLEAAIELRHPARTPQALRDTATATFPQGAALDVRLHVRNAGEKDISFWSETWRQDDAVVVIGDDGKEKTLEHSWYSGWARVERWTLKPGQSAVLPAISVAVVADREAAEKLEHPVGPTIIGVAGQYRLRIDLSFNKWKRESPGGKTIPGPEDFQGSLSTGVATITVREREPGDDPPTFTARLLFQSPDGKPIAAGEVEVRRQAGKELAKGEFQAGQFEVPRCPFESLRVSVRAKGYEETQFYEVAVKPNESTPLTLKPAQPLRFRLVSRD